MRSCSKTLWACSTMIGLVLTSCGGGGSKPAPMADFSLSATPTTVTLLPGGTTLQISINAVPINGFASMVSVAITGLPSEVTAQPAMLTLTPGTAQTVALTASAAATAGSAMLTLTATSGMLSHTTTVTATISPPPDFTLALSPTSLSITAGTTGSPVSITANPTNSFTGTVAIAITGLPSDVTATPATLTLTPGTAQTITLAAAPAAVAATSTVTFTGTSGSLTHSASLTLTVQAAPTANAPDVTTFHYDIARDGLNPQETILTQSNVNSSQFGKIGFDTVDGKVDAQPLYLANVMISGQQRNILYVATEHASVYAFDADTGAQLWKTSVLSSGETTSDDHNCSQITPEIGITSTPVIDRKQGTNGTLFTVAMSKDSTGAYHQRLHALDITTGAEITGSPTEITATYPGTGDNTQKGNVVFDPAQYAERAALLLLNGNIYMGWTSHCDIGLYTGWVMAHSELTLQQTQLLDLTPNGHEGSIWMSGGGIAADSQSNIYLLDANGTFDAALDPNGFPTKGDYGNAMVKLSTTGKLAVADYFEMYNTASESSEDLDLGSGGALLLPDQTDANGIVHHLIVGAGKDKNIYLADRDNLGKFNPATAPMDSNIYQQLTGAMAGLVYSTPAYFNNVLYYAADGDTLKAFPLTNAQLALIPSSQTTIKFPHPGPTPSISANGTQNGIVWALESSLTSPGVLHAYDPANLEHEFYNSTQAVNGRDGFGNGNKFITPMIVNGKVYVGTQNGVAVFGLLPTAPSPASSAQHSAPHIPASQR
jgi:outer membrane protein assembly factor BamB